MTTFASARGTVAEVEHGRAIADAAVAVGVPHVVYSSVRGRRAGHGHSALREQMARGAAHAEIGVPLSVVRPTFFMDNFDAYFTPVVEHGVSVLRASLRPDVPLRMVAVSDICELVATVMLAPDRVAGDAIEIAGDELTAEQMAEVFGGRAGLPARFDALPIAAMGDDDQEAMFTWFERLPGVMDFAAFVAQRQ